MPLLVTPWIRQCINAPFVPQRSAEWFELRRSRITGSMCDTLLGTNRFQTWDELVAEKAGMPVVFRGNAATQHGIDNEPKAIRLYEEQTGRHVVDLGLTGHPTIDILAHSPDGISLKRTTAPPRAPQTQQCAADFEEEAPALQRAASSGERASDADEYRLLDEAAEGVDADADDDSAPVLLEIKCPYSRKITPGTVPKYYVGQLQLGLHVFNLKRAHFVQYKEDPYTLDITVVHRDEGWLERHLPRFEQFWREVDYWKRVGWRRHPHVQKRCRHLLYPGEVDFFARERPPRA